MTSHAVKPPTKFQSMRRNRLLLEALVKAREADELWMEQRQRFVEERAESFEDTRDWLAETATLAGQRKQADLRQRQSPLVSARGERLMWWPWRRRAA